MLFIFALPVMQVILFCLAIGRDPTGLHLAVVNKEMDWETMNCPVYNNCTLSMFSCRYLNSLPKDTVVLVSVGRFAFSLWSQWRLYVYTMGGFPLIFRIITIHPKKP